MEKIKHRAEQIFKCDSMGEIAWSRFCDKLGEMFDSVGEPTEWKVIIEAIDYGTKSTKNKRK